MSLTIRTAEPSEFAAVGELCVRAYDGLLPQDHFYIEVLRDAAARAADAVLLVAVDDDSCSGPSPSCPRVGRCRRSPSPTRASSGCSRSPPPPRAAGSAPRCCSACSTTAARRAGPRVVCSSQPSMRAAHTIYQRLGFERLPERDWSPVPDVDLLAFGVALTTSR